MELISKIGVIIVLSQCLQYSRVVICQTTSTTDNPTATSSDMTSVFSQTTMNMTSESSMTTSNEPSVETSTPSIEPNTSESTPEQQTTTPEPQTTTAPPPTSPPAVPKHYDAKAGNVTCLVMDAAFEFAINYFKIDNTEAKVNVPVPENATFEGDCLSNNLEDLKIFLFNNNKWTFTIKIETDTNQTEDSAFMAADDVSYSWTEVTLVYTIDNETFPDARDVTGQPITVTATNLHLFESNNQGSYKCVAPQTINLENVTLTVKEFQYRAFGKTESEDYPDSGINECPADKKDDDDDDTGKLIGIIVGSVVGGLIILTVVVYLIQRARKRGSYEKV